MKTKRIPAPRNSQRHRRVARHQPCAELPTSREHACVDAAIIFTDSHASGRTAVWLEPQSADERACTTSPF